MLTAVKRVALAATPSAQVCGLVLASWLTTALIAGCASGVGPAVTPASTTALAPTRSPERHTLTGTLSAHANWGCIPAFVNTVGLGRQGDVRPGAQVLIRDDSDRVIATTKLDIDPTIVQPVSTSIADINAAVNALDGPCRYVFKVDVPDSPFYSVSIAGLDGPVYSRSDLDGDQWHVGVETRG